MTTYTELILTEIRTRHRDISHRQIDSIYFGGGTPSLLPISNILSIMRELNNVGFGNSPGVEITIEINPGTFDQERLDQYRALGINRFSLGVQTFNARLLNAMGREHSVDQTHKDISLLQKSRLNFTVDFLFGLPHQSLEEFKTDLETFASIRPPHLSAYNLTVPTGHPMSKGRADDSVQAQMFDLIEDRLSDRGVFRYEISNYAQPGSESRHNSLYWNDGEYWGLGVSAHSYLKTSKNPLGVRFWNSPAAKLYREQCFTTFNKPFFETLPPNQVEFLGTHEALTDFCHTQLRKLSGLRWTDLTSKFGELITDRVSVRFRKAKSLGLVNDTPDGFALSAEGRRLSNKSFLEFTFLPEDL